MASSVVVPTRMKRILIVALSGVEVAELGAPVAVALRSTQASISGRRAWS